MKNLFKIVILLAAVTCFSMVSCDMEPNIEYVYDEYGTVVVYNTSNYTEDDVVWVDISNMNNGDIWAYGYIFAGDYFMFVHVPAGVPYVLCVEDTAGNLSLSDPFTLSKDQTRVFTYDGMTIARM